jgi:hypothetical protein
MKNVRSKRTLAGNVVIRQASSVFRGADNILENARRRKIFMLIPFDLETNRLGS